MDSDVAVHSLAVLRLSACPGPAIETGTKRTWPAAVRTSLKSVPEPAKGGGEDEDEEGIPPCLVVSSGLEWR